MSENNITLEFSAKALAPLSLFMAKNDIRYYLMGMYVAPHPSGTGCVIAASDGHRIGYWYDKEGICTEPKIVNVGAGIIAAARKWCEMRKTVQLIGGRLVLIEGGYRETFVQAGKAEIDAKYPDIWKLIPNKDTLKPGFVGCINPKYLRDLGDVVRLAGLAPRFASAIQHFHEEKDDQSYSKIVTLYEGIDDDFMVITMPMSGDCKLPECFFIEPKEEPKKAAAKKKPARAKAKGGAA